MVLTGFGYYLYPDESVKYFWEIKNSFGTRFGMQGYWDILNNSSQSVESWKALEPLAPIVLDLNEPRTYIENHLVESVSITQLSEIVGNTNLDVIILFYDENKEDKSYVEDFQKTSRIYLTERADVKFLLVNRTSSLTETQKYFLDESLVALTEEDLVLRYYKYTDGTRSMSESGDYITGSSMPLKDMTDFLYENVGGFMGE